MHPEYPSQAAIVAGAASAVLVAALGDRSAGSITVVDSGDAKVTRQFPGIAAIAEEQRMVRIWGGIHFRTSLETSDGMGRALVQHVIGVAYRPVR
jgi:hypothetical protein